MRLRQILACAVLLLGQAAGSARATSFYGEFWNVTGQVRSVAEANAVIAGSGPTATFRSTAIDYPNGPAVNVSDTTTLASYLGADAATLSGSGGVTLENSVFRFTGFLDLLGGLTRFTVGSDDGFRLTVGGVVVAFFNGRRSFASTNVNLTMAAGRTGFELLYFENTGRTGVEFRVNNALALPAAVPLPASLPLALAGLAALGLLGRRRKMRSA